MRQELGFSRVASCPFAPHNKQKGVIFGRYLEDITMNYEMAAWKVRSPCLHMHTKLLSSVCYT